MERQRPTAICRRAPEAIRAGDRRVPTHAEQLLRDMLRWQRQMRHFRGQGYESLPRFVSDVHDSTTMSDRKGKAPAREEAVIDDGVVGGGVQSIVSSRLGMAPKIFCTNLQ